MIIRDGAEHARLRKLITRAFTPRPVERLRPRIEALVDSALTPYEEAGGGDLMEGLAFPLPVRAIAELLGVTLADCDQFRPLMQDLAGMFEMDPGPGVLDAAVVALLRRVDFFAGCSDAQLTGIASTAYPITFEALRRQLGTGHGFRNPLG